MRKLVLSSLIVLAAVFAEAKKMTPPALSDTATVEQDKTYIVPLNATQMKVEPLDKAIMQKSVDYELLVSNWQPSNFSRPSTLPNASSFNVNGFPQISFNRRAVMSEQAAGYFETVFGFSYTQLQRTAPMGVTGGNTTQDENVYLFGLRGGVSYRFARLLSSRLQPSVAVALLPSWMGAPSSSLETNGASGVGLPVEASFELMYSPDFMRSSFASSGGGFGIGGHSVFGSVGSTDVSGNGLDVIVRYLF